MDRLDCELERSPCWGGDPGKGVVGKAQFFLCEDEKHRTRNLKQMEELDKHGKRTDSSLHHIPPPSAIPPPPGPPHTASARPAAPSHISRSRRPNQPRASHPGCSPTNNNVLPARQPRPF